MIFTSLLGPSLAKFVRMPAPLYLNRTPRPVPSVCRTEDYADMHHGVACLHPERNLHVQPALDVEVVLEVFSQQPEDVQVKLLKCEDFGKRWPPDVTVITIQVLCKRIYTM